MAVTQDFQYPPGITPERERLVDYILWTLHLYGPFEDQEGGRAMAPFRHKLIELGATVPEAPSLLSSLTREMTSPKYGEYVYKDVNSTRTYEIRLGAGVTPDKVPFPPCPFEYETDEEYEVVDELDEVVEVDDEVLAPTAPAAVNGGGDVGDAAELALVLDVDRNGQDPAHAAAMELVAAAVKLAREVAARPVTAPVNGQVDWIKDLVAENAHLRSEVERLTRENTTLTSINGLLSSGAPVAMVTRDPEYAPA